ncbi:methylmalonyl-CoA decarboxylase [Escherichia coli]|uniref:Methylmalonyl-CoA decarboxylase n=1 Tax=Escherichia coli TaxID=562 RepID=A0A376NU57_ECOLX|nr:methylmalonyl-CoA decarboxylase [Escherichia coli]
MNSDEFERIQGMRRAVYDSEDYQEGMNAFLENVNLISLVINPCETKE